MKKKTNVSHSCGCVESHEFNGSEEENKRKVSWLSTRPCTKCWKKTKEAEQSAETERAKELATAKKLPALSGSEKQIPWAMRIRQGMIDALAEITKASGADDEKVISQFEAAFARNVVTKDSANWFLDHRSLKNEDALRSQLEQWIMQEKSKENKAS